MPKRSPCSPQSRRLPNYKADARRVRRGSKETFERRRYVQDPEASVCRLAPDDHVGRTACYNETMHSARRKTCKLLAPDERWINNFPPGLYLWGTDIFSGPEAQALVCTSTDMIMYDTEDVDTRRGTPPPRFSLTILGPYPHPVTKKLVVKCLPTSVLDQAVTDVFTLGGCFETMERDEQGVMVPSVHMLRSFLQRADAENCPYSFNKLRDVVSKLVHDETQRDILYMLCENDPARIRGVRSVLRHYFEAAQYFRRWGGPGQPYATSRVLPAVGTPNNPISAKLRGKILPGGGNADFVDSFEGRLLFMERDALQKVLKSYDALDTAVQRALTKAMLMGTRFRTIDGSGYWLTSRDMYTDGNPSTLPINLFDMCFGTPAHSTPNPRNFVAVVSIQGSGTYCVQVGATFIIRSVQTLIYHMYNNVPNWAKADGEFESIHT